MEALAAVSLAGSILQFLNFTGDAISKSRQIHASVNGTLKEHDDLETITTDLKDLSVRLQASAGPVDSALERLCIRCQEIADELLKALESLCVKGKYTRSQSLRKALKVLWGKEKLKVLEERLALFRQELTLHVTVELRSRIDIMGFQQTHSFQALDYATKENAQKILDVLLDNRDQLLATTNGQTRQLRALHAQTDMILNNGFESAAVNLSEQSRTTRALTTKEHEKSRTEVINAITDAASGYDDALSTEVENISACIEEANQTTRAQITETLNRNQDIMKQEIHGLQRGLRQLQLEIDRKAEKLKEIVLKINTTREGADRNLLKERGNSATVVLMSLYELYKALQRMSKKLAQQALITFGTQFWLRGDQSAIKSKTTFELDLDLGHGVSISLPMYYVFYYQPLFENLGHQRLSSEIFSSTKMNARIHAMSLTRDDPHEISPEVQAFFDLATNGNELVWTMTTLVAGLNACLAPEEAIQVLSTAFSLRYDPRCVLPKVITLSYPDLPSQVALFFDKGSATALQMPLFGLDCTLGRRLKEDYDIMSHLANKCGLQEEISMTVNMGRKASTAQQRADLTLALVALTSQPSCWHTYQMKRETFTHHSPRILFYKTSLYVDPSADLVVDFLYAIQSAGILITINGQDTYPFPPSHNLEILDNGLDLDSYYRSKEYNHHLKTQSWWPSSDVYLDWRSSFDRELEIFGRELIPEHLGEESIPELCDKKCYATLSIREVCSVPGPRRPKLTTRHTI